jgi:hypothetical protein
MEPELSFGGALELSSGEALELSSGGALELSSGGVLFDIPRGYRNAGDGTTRPGRRGGALLAL